MTVLMPRGLAAAILAINFGPIIISGMGLGTELNSFFKDVAFVVILGTAIITTIGVSIISYYERKKLKQANTTVDTCENDEIFSKQL